MHKVRDNDVPELKRDYGITLVILLYWAMTFFGVAVAAL